MVKLSSEQLKQKGERVSAPCDTDSLDSISLSLGEATRLSSGWDVYSRPGPQTWKVHLTDDLIRNSIDNGDPITVEEAGDFLTYGTRIYLRKLKKSFSVAKLYEYVAVAFAPLLTWQFRILINENEAIAPELPAGIMHERSGEGY